MDHKTLQSSLSNMIKSSIPWGSIESFHPYSYSVSLQIVVPQSQLSSMSSQITLVTCIVFLLVFWCFFLWFMTLRTIMSTPDEYSPGLLFIWSPPGSFSTFSSTMLGSASACPMAANPGWKWLECPGRIWKKRGTWWWLAMGNLLGFKILGWPS